MKFKQLFRVKVPVKKLEHEKEVKDVDSKLSLPKSSFMAKIKSIQFRKTVPLEVMNDKKCVETKSPILGGSLQKAKLGMMNVWKSKASAGNLSVVSKVTQKMVAPKLMSNVGVRLKKAMHLPSSVNVGLGQSIKASLMTKLPAKNLLEKFAKKLHLDGTKLKR